MEFNEELKDGIYYKNNKMIIDKQFKKEKINFTASTKQELLFKAEKRLAEIAKRAADGIVYNKNNISFEYLFELVSVKKSGIITQNISLMKLNIY